MTILARRLSIVTRDEYRSPTDSSSVDVNRWEMKAVLRGGTGSDTEGPLSFLAGSEGSAVPVSRERCLMPHHKEPAHRRPHTASNGQSISRIRSDGRVDRLHREATWDTGQNAKTLMKYGDFRVVLTVLKATGCIPEHQTTDESPLMLLSGHIRLNASGRTFNLRPGSLLALNQGCPSCHRSPSGERVPTYERLAWHSTRLHQDSGTANRVM